MKTIIAGSRSITSYPILQQVILSSNSLISCVISGKARGVDALGELYALNNHLPLIECPADWARFGRSAGFNRNWHMGEIADQAIILWDGYSKGTLHMINVMKKLDKPYYVEIFNV